MYELEVKKDFSKVKNPGLIQFVKSCEELSKIKSEYKKVPNIKNNQEVRGINPKKLHEISAITKFFQDDTPTKVLEIGGGKGNLSFVLCKTYGTHAVSIDMNK